MSAVRFYNSIPKAAELSGKDLVAHFVYYLTVEQGEAFATAGRLTQCFEECDLSIPNRMPNLLSEGVRSKPQRYVKATTGYRLHRSYSDQISNSLGANRVVIQTSAELRKLETQLPDGPTKTFLVETIDCFEAGANRAAIVMAWILAMNVLNNYVINNKLLEFNAALAKAPAGKVTSVATYDDLTTELKESKVIEIAKSAGIITKDVWKVMDQALGTRNSCGHPATVIVKRSKAVSVIEDLFENVISRF
ncbi:MAG: hypothetical protein IOC86_07185 [Aestuariivirga sp.]|nr:hypothetical protein [Aestuariivirga sp.]